MAGYIFGGNTGISSPQELERQRAIANALAQSVYGGGAPRNVGEGLTEIGRAIARRRLENRITGAEKSGQDSANAAFNPIIAALGGGGAFPAAPGVQSANVDMPTQRVASAFGDQPGPANGYFDAIRSAESGGSDSAKNPRSSATGRYQFTKGTWDGLMTTHPELGLTPDGRTDPAQQERAIRVFTAQNANQLQDAGIQPTGGNLYAAHFLGAGGAKNVLTQPDNAPISSFVGPEVVKANPFLANMTVGQFKQWAAGKGGGAPGAFRGTVPANSSVAMSGPPTQVAQAANAGAPGQMSDANALKLLGASPVTRDAQGGPSIAMLLRSAANPWTNKNESAVVQALLAQKMKAADPSTQLDMRYKQAQLDALEHPIKAPTVQQFYDAKTGQAYEAQWNTKTQSWDKVGGNKASSNGITVSPDGTVQIGGPTKPLTESQSKDAVFFTRGSGALPILDKFGSALTSLPEKTAGGAPIVGNYLKSKEYQQAENAGLEFLQAILRKDTGAAITPAETAEYGKTYLPQPGDGPEVLAQKKAARHRALAAIKAGLPPTAILALEKAGVDLGQGDLPKAGAPKKTVIDGYTIEQVE